MAFVYKLVNQDGTPADPPRAPDSRADLATGRHDPDQGGRTLRVVDTRLGEDADGDPVLVLIVDEFPGRPHRDHTRRTSSSDGGYVRMVERKRLGHKGFSVLP